tara:strand:- start:155 stop:769 length:615 start_codon:yes stop_codon:yes gene_type:complete
VERYFLPFVFTPVLAIRSEIFNFYYFPILLGVSAFVLFWNFPWLVYYTASRPLYYEDLFIDEKKLPNYEVNPKLKNKFQSILIWMLIVTNSLLVSALGEYWLYKTFSNSYTTVELFGVTGGIIKIFQIINNTISRIMLKILRKIIKNENLKIKKIQKRDIQHVMSFKFKTSNDEKQNREHKDMKEEMEMENVILRPNRSRLATI